MGKGKLFWPSLASNFRCLWSTLNWYCVVGSCRCNILLQPQKINKNKWELIVAHQMERTTRISEFKLLTAEKDVKVWMISYGHNLTSCDIKAWKQLCLDLCDTSAVLLQLSYQVNNNYWELVTLWVCNITINGEKCRWVYTRPYIST